MKKPQFEVDQKIICNQEVLYREDGAEESEVLIEAPFNSTILRVYKNYKEDLSEEEKSLRLAKEICENRLDSYLEKENNKKIEEDVYLIDDVVYKFSEYTYVLDISNLYTKVISREFNSVLKKESTIEQI